jgi:hypothetical protein
MKNIPFDDIVGQKFNRLIALRRISRSGQTRFLFRCDCGNEPVLSASNVVRGHTKSCGCLKAEGNNLRHGRARKHSRSRLYTIWISMKARCTNVRCARYADYGGRGIAIDPQWNDFSTFQLWAVNNGYSDDLEIDRIDNDGNYGPSNCRWVSRTCNSNNRRSSNLVSAWGETKSTAEWARDTRCAFLYDTLRRRCRRAGMSPEEAISGRKP